MANEAASVQVIIEAEDRASSVLDNIVQKIEGISEIGKISDNLTAGIEEALSKLGEIDGKSGTITFGADSSEAIAAINEAAIRVNDFNSMHAAATLDADASSVAGAVAMAQSYVDSFHGKSVQLHVETVYTTSGSSNYNTFYAGAHWAKGTKDAPEGIAMVNDERGISDPRELIEHNGRLMMFEGRNVLVPLARHDKVYTAKQTAAIMRSLGIPRYARGRNNSDNFYLAKEALNHNIKTGSMTFSEELEKWEQLMKNCAETEKDIWDCEEEIFSLQQKINKELNDESQAWIEVRTALNDWEEFDDNAIDAFNRVKERNRQNLDEGKITWAQYVDTCSKIGQEMYDERVKQSLKWLEHERKYNNFSREDYIAGLQRMAAYTKEYYEQGLIDKKKYIEAATEIDEKYLDAYSEKNENEYKSWKKDVQGWFSDRNMYNDWAEFGDSKNDFYARAIERVSQFYKEGKIDWQTMMDDTKEYADALYKSRANGDEVYSKWLSNSENWKQLRDTYDDWEEYGDSAVSYYQRCIDRISQMYQQGHITWQKYMDETMNYEMDLYLAFEDKYDDILSSQYSYISQKKKEFADEEQKLRDSWEESNRNADMNKVNKLIAIYKNSVTERGMDKYSDLLEEKERLNYEADLYELQESNNYVLKRLQEKYEKLESEKKVFLKAIRDADVSAESIARTLTNQFSGFGTETKQLLNELISAVNGIKISGGTTNNNTSYTDNRTINVSSKSVLATPGNVEKFLASVKG